MPVYMSDKRQLIYSSLSQGSCPAFSSAAITGTSIAISFQGQFSFAEQKRLWWTKGTFSLSATCSQGAPSCWCWAAAWSVPVPASLLEALPKRPVVAQLSCSNRVDPTVVTYSPTAHQPVPQPGLSVPMGWDSATGDIAKPNRQVANAKSP